MEHLETKKSMDPQKHWIFLNKDAGPVLGTYSDISLGIDYFYV